MYQRDHKVKRRHHIVVTANTGDDFQRKLEEVEQMLAEDPDVENVTYVYNMNRPEHCAYFDYERKDEFCRTIAEEYEARGQGYCCSDCVLYHPSGDRRIRFTTCDAGKPRRAADSYACEEFYEMMEALLRR